MSFHALVYLPPQLNLAYASKLLAGLSGLESGGAVQYELSRKDPWGLDSLTVAVTVTQRGETRHLAFDLRDRSDIYCQPALEKCDILWKRSLVRSDLDTYAPELRAKVRPLGSIHPCRGKAGLFAVLRRQMVLATGAGLQLAKGNAKPLKDRIRATRNYVAFPTPEEFRARATDPVSSVVLFQTRVWEPSEVFPDSVEEINDGRVAIIRALKARLGDRFWGGLVPNETARRLYPDCLATLPTHRDQYLALSKKAAISVYSRGIHHSIAFKLGESLAASHALVSDPIRHELPVPLREGANLLTYHTPEQCADRCEELLGNPELLASMRRANDAYYAAEVEPQAQLLKCLRKSFEG